ncbi:MAG TPA: ABC transporter ATP-binding protein [Candidatus Nanopelagicales bacterium]|nr:ABC transporter ATP-binding protein [Candidatus Nanopelagicales bacterium]
MTHASAPTTTDAITLNEVRRSYGAVVAVDGIDLRIRPGEVVALLGPNGAGKSTTIDMVLGLAAPDSGTVLVGGTSPAQAVARGDVGAMLQTGGLIPDVSVRELVTMLASLYPDPLDVDDVLRRTGLVEVADRRAAKLSGGQTQRVRFALALVSNPALLVLDEPTVALDVEGRHEFWTSMRELTQDGRTVLFATHYLEEADTFADRIVLMAAGRIVADGPATEIKAVVGLRTIRATLPDVALDELEAIDGVRSAARTGSAVTLQCDDADLALRALLPRYPQARDLEVTGAGLEQAFRILTADQDGVAR